jgi:replicative DNA helicase
MTAFEQIKAFYRKHLPQAEEKAKHLTAPCPFCSSSADQTIGKIDIDVDERSYFRGYFTCTAHCNEGGFHFHFGALMGIEADGVPGFDPDATPYAMDVAYPNQHLETEITQFISLLGDAQAEHFARFGVTQTTLGRLKVGFNGRYLVYPYIQETGLAYAARCVMPGRPGDNFWHGNESFSKAPFNIYNVREIDRCKGGALIITEGEPNLLILKELGYPAISVPAPMDLSGIPAQRLEGIDHVFLLVANTPEALQSASKLAVNLGFKARILSWPSNAKRGRQLSDLAAEDAGELGQYLAAMIETSKSFSPFASPEKEQRRLVELLAREKGRQMLGLKTGFPKLDIALDGLRGINILGGPPKAGKSSFFMQISTELALHHTPVIYYDFENGRQKIYLRTIVRLSGIPEKNIRTGGLDPAGSASLKRTLATFGTMLNYFRVVTDRELTPDVMRRHIDFLKKESRRDKLLVVLDSLHKLPFRDLSERRTGIDFWLRQCEAIRDEEGADFLIISELSRDRGGNYGEKPDLGSFKASGDIAYSADNAMILMPAWDPLDPAPDAARKNNLWLVASRENNPGRVAAYTIDFPYWRFLED